MVAGGGATNRLEDHRLLTCGGTYVADVEDPRLDGALAVHFVRSDVASAHLVGIDTEVAQAMAGVQAVFTGADVDIGPMPPVLPRFDPIFSPPIVAKDTVRHVGEVVAAVVATTPAQAADAAEAVVVHLRPAPTVVAPRDALGDQVLVIAAAGTNHVGHLEVGTVADGLFDACEVVVRFTAEHPRIASCPLETRAAASAWDGDRLHHWVSTQGPHSVRRSLAAVFGLEESAIRVVAPDVGGGFGPKFAHFVEDVFVAWIARRLARPVRWVESRSESMIGLHHGRGQSHEITIGGNRDGRLSAYQLDVVQDSGAYASLGAYAPEATLRMTTGVYDIGRARGTARSVLTHTTPVSAYRGTGRPEATCAIERAVDRFARVVGLDPVELRRHNLISERDFPYTTAVGTEYDSGNYVRALDLACAVVGYEERRSEQRAQRESSSDELLGIGVAVYVESTGAGPAMEFATLRMGCGGDVEVDSGASPQGQGHRTTWTAIASTTLGVDPHQIAVRFGDTDTVAMGLGTFASRSTQFAGSAIHQGATQLVQQGRTLAARHFEASLDDVVFDVDAGEFAVAGVPGVGIGWSALLTSAGVDELREDTMFLGSMTFPFGAHIAVVAVDSATGAVGLIRHVAVDDAGTIVSETLAEGQVHGGIAQGVGEALFEEFRHGEGGIPITTNFSDYAIPSAAELPYFESSFTQTPAPSNPLGAKGIGESGVIGAVAAIQNAVCDAVAHLGVTHIDLPLTPQRVWDAMQHARVATAE